MEFKKFDIIYLLRPPKNSSKETINRLFSYSSFIFVEYGSDNSFYVMASDKKNSNLTFMVLDKTTLFSKSNIFINLVNFI